MDNVVRFFGWACIAWLCLCAAGFAVALAADQCRRALQRFEWAIDSKTRQDIGRSLDATGWWFSECPDTSMAVRIIGARLARGEGIDADSMRDQWRKARAEGKPEVQK